MANEPQFFTNTIKRAGGVDRLVFNRFAIRVVAGPDKGAQAEFGQELVQVGSGRANDLVLSDRTVSRFHCKIETRGGVFNVVDLGSTNGTTVGGFRIQSIYVDAECEIAVGSTRLSFKPLKEKATEELPGQDHLGALIGSSARMRQLYGQITRVAPSALSVIIEGETGTGKELVARVIHDGSPRADKPFEVLDCSAIPENLVESELFGHVKGSFTGADRDRAGIFERAHGGTVFLDEIGELTAELQPKLLRVLETHQLRRVGDNRTIKADVRVVAATHRSLRTLVNKGSFREDLYYRLAACRLDLPPLRERVEDIPLLVDHFVAKLDAGDFPHPITVPDAETLRMFESYPWPGNVRQLKNTVERLAVMGAVSLGDDAPEPHTTLEQAAESTTHMSLHDAKEYFERCYLEALVRKNGGNTRRAASVAEVHPKSLLRLLRRHTMARG